MRGRSGRRKIWSGTVDLALMARYIYMYMYMNIYMYICKYMYKIWSGTVYPALVTIRACTRIPTTLPTISTANRVQDKHNCRETRRTNNNTHKHAAPFFVRQVRDIPAIEIFERGDLANLAAFFDSVPAPVFSQCSSYKSRHNYFYKGYHSNFGKCLHKNPQRVASVHNQMVPHDILDRMPRVRTMRGTCLQSYFSHQALTYGLSPNSPFLATDIYWHIP